MFKAQNFKYFKIVLFLLLFFSSFFSIYSEEPYYTYSNDKKSSSSGESSSSDDEEFTKAYKKLFINPKELSFSCSGDASLTTQEKKSEFGELLSLIKQIFLSLCFLIFFFGQNPVFFVILFSFITSILIVIMLKTSDFNGNAGATIKKIAPILGLIIFIFLCVAIVPVAETFVKNIPTMVVLILSITAAAIFSPMLVPKSKEGNNYILVFAFIFVFYFANCGIVFLISDQFSFVFPFYDGITKGIFSLTEIIVFIFLVILFLTAFKLVFKSKSGFEDSMGLNNEPTLGTAKKVAKAVGKGIGNAAKSLGRNVMDFRKERKDKVEALKKSNLKSSLLRVLELVGLYLVQIIQIIRAGDLGEDKKKNLKNIIKQIEGLNNSFNSSARKISSDISQEEFNNVQNSLENLNASIYSGIQDLNQNIEAIYSFISNYFNYISRYFDLKIEGKLIDKILSNHMTHLELEELRKKFENLNVDDSKVNDSKVNDSKVNDSKVNDSNVDDSNVDDSKVNDSKVNDSKVNDSKVNDSKVNDSNVDDSNVDDSKVNDSNVDDSKVNDSKVNDSKVNDSNVDDSKVNDSNVDDSKVNDSNVDDSTVSPKSNPFIRNFRDFK